MHNRIVKQHALIRSWSDQEADNYERVRRMLLHERGQLVRAVAQLSDQYELTRVDGAYEVIQDGRVVPSLRVRRCQDGVCVLVKPHGRPGST